MNYGRPLINGLFSSRVSSMPTNVKAPLLGLGGSICLFAARRSFFSKTASSSAKAAENLPKVFFDVKVWLGENGISTLGFLSMHKYGQLSHTARVQR